MTRWEEEIFNDRIGVESSNSDVDFFFDDMDRTLRPANKRQKIVYQAPWFEPSTRTMRIVSTARDQEYKRLRASWLSEGFKHWKKLISLGYPHRRAPKFIKGLKEEAEAVSLRRKYLDIVLAAKTDMFKEAFRADELEMHLEGNASAIGKIDEGQSVSTSNEQLL